MGTTLPINIEYLLSGKAVEGNRLDYKEGWNPDSIYRTICAFANDFDDAGGGYIVIGVEEKDGRAIRPVKGVNPDSIEQLLIDTESNLTGNLKEFYLAMKENPIISVEELSKLVGGKLKLSNQLISRLKKLGYVRLEGRRYGQWIILKN